jgi:tRNA threonylcarbamoyl adenosine modification protein YeaZ
MVPDVRVLAIDTATAATAVALVSFAPDGSHEVLAQHRHVDPRAHAEVLAPLVDRMLAEAGLQAADLTAIVAGDGPGPFTGLRVGLATAEAMAQALEIPAYGVCSLDGIGAATADEEGTVLVATDARRREIYWALYSEGRRLTEPAVGRPADVVPVLAERDVRMAYGEGALRYRDVLGLRVGEHPTYPEPAVLAVVARERVAARAPGERLTPRYLRRADAAEPGPRKPVSR